MKNRSTLCWALGALLLVAPAAQATWSIIIIDTRTKEIAIGSATCLTNFDLRRGPANSGTPFRQIHDALAARGLPFRYLCLGIARAANTPALFATARDCGATWLHDEELVWPRWDAACRAIDAFVDSVDALQLSVCLDAFPAGAAPGVSAPAARGIAPDFALSLLGHLLARARHGGKGSKVVLAEVAELAPCLDPDGRTARLAGRVVYDVVSGLL